MPRLNLANPPRLPMVLPSILSADFAELGAECEQVLAMGADGLHIDVMDGHFVPNLTMGPAVVRSLRHRLPETWLDVHLMVEKPTELVEAFADAGADHLTVHAEVVPVGERAAMVERIRSVGCTAGLALNPDREIDLDRSSFALFDLILVMSVFPGFSGQAFIEESVQRCSAVRRAVSGETRVEMDGGISPATSRAVREAGCDVLVAASAVFGVQGVERQRVMESIRGEP